MGSVLVNLFHNRVQGDPKRKQSCARSFQEISKHNPILPSGPFPHTSTNSLRCLCLLIDLKPLETNAVPIAMLHMRAQKINKGKVFRGYAVNKHGASPWNNSTWGQHGASPWSKPSSRVVLTFLRPKPSSFRLSFLIRCFSDLLGMSRVRGEIRAKMLSTTICTAEAKTITMKPMKPTRLNLVEMWLSSLYNVFHSHTPSTIVYGFRGFV